jgi:pimeloyl-ACP methyl ester carboxylesterase
VFGQQPENNDPIAAESPHLMTSPRHPAPLGHELIGTGPTRVVIMNDWLCDTSTWDGPRAYLDGERFTYALADLRGYGRSKGRSGTFTLPEAAADVLGLVAALDWERFAIVGHSMSALVALHLVQQRPERIERAVVLTPPPPKGFGADESALAGSRGLALADEATRGPIFSQLFGTRLSPGWARFKDARWRACADAEAAAAYVTMFARDGLPDAVTPIVVPVLAITGEQDAPSMRRDAVTRALTPLCKQLTVTPLADSGHYPMQEMPPLTVALVERFLGA